MVPMTFFAFYIQAPHSSQLLTLAMAVMIYRIQNAPQP